MSHEASSASRSGTGCRDAFLYVGRNGCQGVCGCCSLTAFSSR